MCWRISSSSTSMRHAPPGRSCPAKSGSSPGRCKALAAPCPPTRTATPKGGRQLPMGVGFRRSSTLRLRHLLDALHQLGILLDRLADGVEGIHIEAAILDHLDHLVVGFHANFLLGGLVLGGVQTLGVLLGDHGDLLGGVGKLLEIAVISQEYTERLHSWEITAISWEASANCWSCSSEKSMAGAVAWGCSGAAAGSCWAWAVADIRPALSRAAENRAVIRFMNTSRKALRVCGDCDGSVRPAFRIFV